MTIKRDEKLFVVRKYILARSVKEAVRKERTREPDEVFLDDEWKKEHKHEIESKPIGYGNYQAKDGIQKGTRRC